MSRRSGLGKGLSSLIPTAEGGGPGPQDAAALVDVAVGDIDPNPHQPRVHFDEESLAELAASIRQLGVLQPILVRPTEGRYELVAGERRWRAAQRAGLATVPAVVRHSDDIGSVEQALVENLHRQDLTPLEEAGAYQQLIEDFDLTHDDVAARVGKSRSTVTNTLRLLGLPPTVQHLLADGKLSAGHARALLGTPDRSLQELLARHAVSEGWSVRLVEEAVRFGGIPQPAAPSTAAPTDSIDSDTGTDAETDAGIDATPAGGAGTPPAVDGAGLTPATRLRPPGLLELEQLLADRLDTRVGVQMSSKRGKVTIEFADLEDLERIYRRIIGES